MDKLKQLTPFSQLKKITYHPIKKQIFERWYPQNILSLKCEFKTSMDRNEENVLLCVTKSYFRNMNALQIVEDVVPDKQATLNPGH